MRQHAIGTRLQQAVDEVDDLLRNSPDFASWNDRRDLARTLKAIDAAAVGEALEAFDDGGWRPKFPAIGQMRRRAGQEAIPFFDFRKAILRGRCDHNPKRKHVRNGMLSPVEFEKQQKI